VVLAYDADTAGQGAAEHFYDWERKFEVDIAVVALPAGTDPADLALKDPQALHEAVAQAKPYLGFRLERVFSTADLRNPEGRARAAETCLALVAEHPDALVRDQYLMQVADRCHLSSEQLRGLQLPGPRAKALPGGGPGPARASAGPRASAGQPSDGPETRMAGQGPAGLGGPAGGRERPGGTQGRLSRSRVPPPELEALKLAVHEPERVARRLRSILFGSEVAREAFNELASAMTLHAAIEAAQPAVADLLGRLAVEESQEEPDDVLRRLMEQAAARALEGLRREARSPAPSRSHAELARDTASLHLALEALRSIEPGPASAVELAQAEERLLALLVTFE
jgi:DNA primase